MTTGPDGTGCPLPPSWRDHDDRPTVRPDPPGPRDEAFYTALMAFQGADYDRNSFAMGTAVEVAALRTRLGLVAGTSVLDVGCATGRHLLALAADPGCVGVGVDVAPTLVEIADERARATAADVRFVAGDARALGAVPAVRETVAAGGFDVVWSLCQGGLGTGVAGDREILRGMAAALRPGGSLVVTAFHALFAARHLVPGDSYDVVNGVHHHRTEVRGPDHTRQDFDLWTTAWTVRELVGAVAALGLVVEEVVGCEPGRFDADVVRLDDPELLLVARRSPHGTTAAATAG